MSMVKKMLDLSTVHVPGPDPDWGGMRVAEHEYGWVVVVVPEGPMGQDWLPEWFAPIQQQAVENDCLLVYFDSAADVYEQSDLETLSGCHAGFPVYDW
jgi:hypothetical protein